jgi:hypothetical protein
MQTLARFFLQHRRRFARVVLGAGLLLVGRELWPSWPHETELEFVLGPDHSQVVELRVAYMDHGEELHGVSFGFPNGAPSTVRHRVTLPARELVVLCELRARDGGRRLLIRKLRTLPAGVLRIPLGGTS